MAVIVVRTNPDKLANGTFRCSQCRKVGVNFDKMKGCAERDFKRRTGRSAKAKVSV